MSFSSALDNFRRARQRAAMEEIVARLAGRSADLLSFEQARQKLRAKGSQPQGLREIPLDAIVGSTGRYYDFTRSFLPRCDSDAERWARVEMAVGELASMPPIWVYKIGQAYFVDDGHHRVSVARTLGAKHIRAYVIEVRTKVPLSPSDQPDDLIWKAEYADFLERTHLDELRPGMNLSVTVPGQYRVLEEQIEARRYLLEQKQKKELAYPQAAAHWYDEVYLPVMRVIRRQAVLRDFPGRTETDLYVWVSEHRAALVEELGWDVWPDTAAVHLSARFSPRLRRVAARVGDKLREALVPGGLEAGPPPGLWRSEHQQAQEKDRMFCDILVPVSGHEPGWRALDQALEIARREEGSLLHGLHIVPSQARQAEPETLAIKTRFEQRCQEAAVVGNLIVEIGKVADKIVEWGRWADLLVLNLAHPPAPRALSRLSSGFRAIIRRCPTPLLAVPGLSRPLERALLAYDGSAKANEALFMAAYLASQRQIDLTVLTVVEPGRTSSAASVQARTYLEGHQVQATFLQQRGPVGEVITGAAGAYQVDVIIMGGYGFRPLLEAALGSTVDEVLRTSQRPLLICR
ncbi:MAG: universal stress protein [Thermoflexales bacterium]|nr:universal stress protein [Thermoflexales bacterium]